ncbi:RND family efflux transporter [Thermosulfidibacter takaii ABI70S6]|uniref:RND family efflux transporter n=1 Tax=Thermosulfidibacter takaii (strain DSM 17441 / JCM 13301 / NBRC 103674 / ABI70S6) TaxID=1298851 RepID=A0A0S3QRU8_THET7|nr:efflux RND transporter permease subunit [Thermosulfidibacter takaii]BAT71056.1 RND family efflux transporter [Thermosulfidibacter takaii ABI70S6]
MNFVENYVKRPHLITAFIFLVVALGAISFKLMPLNLFPDANCPVITVIVYQPGASAKDMEDKVARPIEKELGTIDLVRKVTSVSNDEIAAISVEFEYEKSLDAAATDVANTLQRIMWKLPKGILPPQIFKVSDATIPVVTLALTPKAGSGLDLAKVRQLAENEIKEDLLRIPNVADVEVFGGYTPEVYVVVDKVKLHRYNLSLPQIIRAVEAQNLNIPNGLIINSQNQYLLKVAGEKKVIEGLKGIVVGKGENGGLVHLKDVANIKILYKERQSLFHGNGKKAIGVNILRSPKGHVTTTLASLGKYLPKIEKKYPGIKFEIVDTQKNIIETSISNLVDSLRDAIMMTVLVILIYLANVRMSALTAISIPFVYFMTFAEMKLLNYELNIVTLTAVILAVGLLVDDAIVVIENIERHYRELGKPIHKAAIEGTQEIILADFAGTYTTVIVLVPIMFIGGYVQKILRPLSTVLALALLNSFVISVTVIPLFAPSFLRGKKEKNRFEKILELFDAYVIGSARKFYVGLLDVGLRHRLLFILVAFLLLMVSRKLMPLTGRDLMPPMDTGILKVHFETDTDTSLEETERILRKMEDIIAKQDGLIMFDAMVGSEPGVISFGKGRTPQMGLITAHFVDRFHRKESLWDIEDRLRKAFKQIPGIKYVDVYDFGATPLSSIAAPIDIMISGDDPKVLDKLAREVERRLLKVRGITSVSRTWTLDKNEVHFVVDMHKAAVYGLSPVEISSQMAAAVKGGVASVFRIPGEDGYTIRVRYASDQRDYVNKLKTLMIQSSLGPVPLRELGQIKVVKTQTTITHQNYRPTVDVYGYRSTMAITHLQRQIDRVLKDLKLPPGYTISKEGEVKKMKESFGRLVKALIFAIILLYFSLVPTFKSWIHPFTIMAAIPLAMIGAIWGLLIVGRHGCMPAFMGMILLAGIVVNNSILLIDFAEKALEKGASLREALEGAVKIRVRPILMTASATIVGMIPIAAQWAVGLERLSPLAVVAIGGLAVSTLLTLVYIPILYSIFHDVKAKFTKSA